MEVLDDAVQVGLCPQMVVVFGDILATKARDFLWLPVTPNYLTEQFRVREPGENAKSRYLTIQIDKSSINNDSWRYNLMSHRGR